MAKMKPIIIYQKYHPIQRYTFSYCYSQFFQYLKKSIKITHRTLKKRADLRDELKQIRSKIKISSKNLHLRKKKLFRLGKKLMKRAHRSYYRSQRKIRKNIKITKKKGLIFSSRKKYLPKLRFKKLKFFNLSRPDWPKIKRQFQKQLKIYQKIILQEWRKIATPPKKKRGRPPKKEETYQYLKKWWSKSWAASWFVVTSFRKKLIISLGVTLLMFLASYGVYDFVFKDLPTAQDLLERRPIVSTKITDRYDQVLFNIYKDENRTLVPISVIPDYLVEATVAIEDQNFYRHQGFDIQGITRAFLANLKGEDVQGGSTITQQLVKNTLLTNERTLKRKIREVLVAITVDAAFSKPKILELYLNEVAYGGSTYGVEEAAQRYFGKSVTQLSLAESALLAGLPAAPSAYSPFGPNPEKAYQRQAEVLQRMYEEGFITQEEVEAALNTPLTFREDIIDIEAPHFVMYVKEILAQKYGEEMVNQGGLKVRTSLDLDLQKKSQEIVTTEVNKLTRLRITNGASLITNPKTGEILAMVGSVNYFDFEHDGQVNVTLRPRQPGSSIKPITYSLAFERGKTPATIIQDTPITFHNPGSPPYSPKNYDGKFHGPVTLRQALASSYNIPAVKLLAEMGVSNMIDKAEAMGITTWGDRSRFGLSLTLGGGEVKMIDMNQVYGTLANYGTTVDVNPILEITTYDGKTLYRNSCALDGKNCPSRKTLSPKAAAQVIDILADNQARTPAFGSQSVLNIPGQQVAVKTGTTNNLRDNWTIGMTSDRVVGVWVGNNDNQPMSYVASGITGASPIWNQIIRLTLSEEQPHVFPTPEGMIKVKICTQTGTLPCSGCPTVREEIFIPGTEPTRACNPNYFKPKETNQENILREKILDGIFIPSNSR